MSNMHLNMSKIKIFCLMSLLGLSGLSLTGCNDYPGAQNDGSVKLAHKPIWGDTTDQQISLGGNCHIDSINDKPGEGPASHTVKQSGPALKVSGWGAISVKEGVMASDIMISLRRNSNQEARLFAVTTRGKRPDVADYFKNSASIDTGFKSALDLSDIAPGDYLLEVIQHKDGKSFKCEYTANIIIEK